MIFLIIRIFESVNSFKMGFVGFKSQGNQKNKKVTICLNWM